jgi:hypothetical protein
MYKDNDPKNQKIVKIVWHYNIDGEKKRKVLDHSEIENYRKRQVVSVT